MITNLLEKVLIFQDNQEFFIDILTFFNPKIKYLSYKLKYPEAETDLIIYLYELLNHIKLDKFNTDIELITYINKCLKNKSTTLFNNIVKNTSLISFISETEIFDIVACKNEPDEYSDIIFSDLISSLPSKQKLVVFYKFYMQLSDMEISKIFKISRQAVNKTQRLALKNLKIELAE